MRESTKNLIKSDEGWSNAPYRCSEGFLTIGWGWNIDANGLPDDIAQFLRERKYILPEHAERLLEIGITRAEKSCRKIYPRFDTFSVNRQDALIDFMFNQGEGNEKKGVRSFKKTNAAINQGDWETAADEMIDSKWAVQVKDRAKKITKLVREG